MSKFDWIKGYDASSFYDRPSGTWMSSGEFYKIKRIYLRKERIRKIFNGKTW
jgi:hypothetical protein